MGELRNCPNCGDFFNFTGIRDVCHRCAAEEEKKYEEVYRFLRKRENRTATVEQIVKATGVDADLLYKWVRKGRLQPALFPNIGYPCEKCGQPTTKGLLCMDCTNDMKKDLETFEAAKEFRESIEQKNRATYLSDRPKNR